MSSVLRETPEFNESLAMPLAEVIELPVIPAAEEVAVQSVIEPVEPSPATAAKRVSSPSTSERTIWAVQQFEQEMARVPLLTREQEIELGTKIQAGIAAQKTVKSMLKEEGHDPLVMPHLEQTIADGQAAEKHMVAANLRLVAWVAKPWRHRKTRLGFDDILQNGTLGLIAAAKGYDPTVGTKFNTYAVPWIRQSITRELDNTDRPIRFPVGAEETRRARERFRKNYEAEFGEAPDESDFLAHVDKIPQSNLVDSLVIEHIQPDSLDVPANNDADSGTIGEFIPGEDLGALDARIIERWEAAVEIDEVLQAAGLTPAERVMYTLSFGVYLPALEGTQVQHMDKREVQYSASIVLEEGMTNGQIGELFGIGPESVRKYNKRASAKIAKAYAARGGSAYLE